MLQLTCLCVCVFTVGVEVVRHLCVCLRVCLCVEDVRNMFGGGSGGGGSGDGGGSVRYV